MRRRILGIAALCATTAVLVSSSVAGAGSAPESWMLMANGNALPLGLAAKVEKAGGTLTSSIPKLGLAFAMSTSGSFEANASKIGGVSSVSRNLTTDWIEPEFTYPPTSADDDRRFDLQWGHTAVDSVGAWNAGYRGAGATIAVLDTGFNLTHADLAPNIVDSKNMTGDGPASGQWTVDPGQPTPPAVQFSHGTHVAGIAAAPDNAFGTIGIAPEAKLVLVKVLEDSGNGSFEDIIEGIVYAADQDVDIINMSLGTRLEKNGVPGEYTAKDAAAGKNAVGRATTYAYQQGTTVIAAAGNRSIDFDHTNSLISLPSMAPHVNTISATTPIGWAKGPGVPYWDGSFDHFASYSNYGQSAIQFAAPGGDDVFPTNEECTIGVAPLTFPCFVFDFVLAPGTGGPGVSRNYFSTGTSMAAPHASGVAAIIIGKNGGSMKPARVEAALAQSADDLGKPGNDDFYGAGRVNAANAVAP